MKQLQDEEFASGYCNQALDEEYTPKILKFGEEHDLSQSHSKTVSILGYPIIYFRSHSIVLFEGQPMFFNNSNLKKMLENIA